VSVLREAGNVVTNLMRNHLNRRPLSPNRSVQFLEKVNVYDKYFPTIRDGCKSIIFAHCDEYVECCCKRKNVTDSVYDLRHAGRIVGSACLSSNPLLGASTGPTILKRKAAERENRFSVDPRSRYGTPRPTNPPKQTRLLMTRFALRVCAYLY
jgi:hypothetical protein